MARWLARRLLHAALTVAIAITLAFFLMRLAPGDPLSRLGDERPMPAAELAGLRARYGLDQPLLSQYATFVVAATGGDFGRSIHYGRPVREIILDRLPASVLLGGGALLLTMLGGALLGAMQALRRDSLLDRTAGVVSLAAYATPSFWLGLVLAWLVGIEWRLLPVGGFRDPLLAPDAPWMTQVVDVLRHLALPLLTLTVVSIGAVMRYQRTAMLEALAQPFVAAARARGLSERRIRWRHALRTSLFPIVTLLGLWLPVLAAGSVFVESVFAWPGLGSLAAEAVGTRDYPLLMGVTLLVAVLVVLGGLLADLAYAALDPRVRPA